VPRGIYAKADAATAGTVIEAGNREQGTGNREQGTGNREQGTGNRDSIIDGNG
jgi:hypothetical protein